MEIKRKYYSLNWKSTENDIASAFTPDGTKLAQDLISELEGVNVLPFDLELKKLSVGNKGLIKTNELIGVKEIWLDYLPNSLAWPLMSEKMKEIIEKHLISKEKIDWIECKVFSKNEQKKYYILRFNEKLDVLDMQKTLFNEVTKSIIKPVFQQSKILNYSVFNKPTMYDLWKITNNIYISEDIRKDLLKYKLKGIEFNKIVCS